MSLINDSETENSIKSTLFIFLSTQKYEVGL